MLTQEEKGIADALIGTAQYHWEVMHQLSAKGLMQSEAYTLSYYRWQRAKQEVLAILNEAQYRDVDPRRFQYESGTRIAEQIKQASEQAIGAEYRNRCVDELRLCPCEGTLDNHIASPHYNPKSSSLKQAAEAYAQSGSQDDYATMLSLVTLDTPEADFPKLVSKQDDFSSDEFAKELRSLVFFVTGFVIISTLFVLACLGAIPV